MRGRTRLFVLVAASLAALLTVGAVAALASVSGEITRAQANESWTVASIAGSASWTACPEHPEEREPKPPPEEEITFGPSSWPPCSWTPYATIAPGSSSAECNAPARHLESSGNVGQGVTLAWKGDTQTVPANASFDVADVPLSGSPGQLLCLSVREVVPEPVMCAFGATEPGPGVEGGWVGAECPAYMLVSHYYTVDAAQLSAPQAGGQGATGPTGNGSSEQGPGGGRGTAAFETYVVPWGIAALQGPRTLMLAWTARYCVDSSPPELGGVGVRWRAMGNRRFRGRITVSLRYPAGQGRRVANRECQAIGQVAMSHLLVLARPLSRVVLLDGSSSPPKRRWPG